ncbi:hypothetical protein LA080_001873 [Diaporthe eres]|uniref:Cytochrome P450 n=1 Tax=Diaporthe vaccinii TaxID=105482 RepID=A0ABR4FBA7_9PEZI|nr:hypothetical protein LA080_001873 [Diaporthe eres]
MPSLISPHVLGAIALVLWLSRLVLTAVRSPVRSIPGPWYSRFTQAVLKYHTIRGRRMYYVDDLHSKYGPIVRIAPDEAAVSSLQATQMIHKVGSGFNKSSFYDAITAQRRDSEPGIFSMRGGKPHAARRKLFARPFSQNSLRANWESVIQSKVRLAVNRIREEAGAEGEADILKWWTLMATDVIAHLSFGESFRMLELGRQTPFIDAVQAALMLGVITSEAPFLRWIGPYIPLKSVKKLFSGEDLILEHGSVAVQNMRTDSANSQNLFGQMLAQADSQEKTDLTDATVRQEATNFIVAGSDTTAVTLTYLVWAVLKRPQLRAALEDEVAALSPELLPEELQQAPLMNSIIDEALRLYGAAPGPLPRTVPEGGATLGDYFIPAGTTVTTHAYTLHRDPNIFPNPLEFDGWRFVKQPLSPVQKAAFMPYGGGTRICIGLHLAYMELRLATALFFRECKGARLSAKTTEDVMAMAETFLIAPKGHFCNVVLS